MKGHVGHAKGLEVDIRLMRNDGKLAGTDYRSKPYSRELTQDLVNALRNHPNVVKILFNDPNVQGVQYYPGHDDHLHVLVRP